MFLPLLLIAASAFAAPAIRLHSDNPRYYEFRGKPAVLVTSAEHYGAVLNGAFNYVKYLDALAKDALNLTRVFSGVYREVPGDFGITRNTLAPAEAAYLSPFLRIGAKFDLSRWNPAYFARLKAFIAEAGKRGIVVEYTLFCVYYSDRMWDVSPLNAKNNINGVGAFPRTEVLTKKHPGMVAIHEAFVRKATAEVAPFDNVIFEICNEPYIRGVEAADDWQRHIAGLIPKTHLVARNIANFAASVDKPDPNVSILNFHYARPPVAVSQNYALGRVIGLDETGFDGTLDTVYRIQAWDFLAAGGAHYNNLDYSFVAGQEDGSFAVPGNSPGGGSADLRAQLGALLRIFSSLDFVRMKPSDTIIGGLPDGVSARTLAREGGEYLIYFHTGRPMASHRPRYVYRTERMTIAPLLNLPAGRYKLEWFHPRTGKVASAETFTHDGGRTHIASPEWSEDVAAVLRVQ
jgi:hypothetical protein